MNRMTEFVSKSSEHSDISNNEITMNVIKRDGTKQPIQFDKVLERIHTLSNGLSVNYTRLAQKVLGEINNNIHTSELDELSARIAMSYMTTHPDWGTLASRIIISNCQKTVPNKFSVAMAQAYTTLADDVFQFIQQYSDELNGMIRPENDFLIDYFGFKTLERSYLKKNDLGKIIETPQYMWLRVSVGIHQSYPDALARIRETYDLMSTKAFTHATPTLFNSGTRRPQLSSCYLIAMKDDSIEGIYDTMKDSAIISKYAGGIGIHIHNIRAQGSVIAGTQGKSNGIVPMLRVFNNSARYIDQGGGKRNGSIAFYIEPWHADIQAFIKLKSNMGVEEERARDLFYAMWMPNLFMDRVERDAQWSLFCPHDCPGLADVIGDDFEALYTRYESEGKARKLISARSLWNDILVSQIETGMPYIVYKDTANQKSNQKNVGIIKSSNLCTEIIEYSSPTETAVCNLASIALPYFLDTHQSSVIFNFDKLRQVVAVMVRNLNRVIDINWYPTPETITSNMRHRPIGLGVQGLADVFALMRFSWESPEAATLNQEIFENIYYAALDESANIAGKYGPYETFKGSPASFGQLQPDLWKIDPTTYKSAGYLDWTELRVKVQTIGIRNSLLVAPMPTASTSQLLGYNECIEPFTTNIYVRRTNAGEFTILNRYLVADLMKLNLWSPELKDHIIADNGSIQGIPTIPDNIKSLYKTVWEVKQKTLIDMAADRGAFICQSQSLNLFIADPTISKLSSMHFYSWRKGLKTGVYYLRTKSSVQAIKFTLNGMSHSVNGDTNKGIEDECILCSS